MLIVSILINLFLLIGILTLHKQIRRYVKALRFYAARKTYEWITNYPDVCPIDLDRGQQARDALQ